jgi:hypothetical protein
MSIKDANAGGRRVMSIEDSPEEHAKVVELVRAIYAVSESADPHARIEALTCSLFGSVQVDFGLSPSETTQFCAKCIEAYAQKRRRNRYAEASRPDRQ